MDSLKVINLKIIAAAALTAVVLSLTGCHGSKSASIEKKREQVEAVHVGKIKGEGKSIVREARSWLGTPYRYAGSEKGEGTDCSGMVLRVYEEAVGIKIPRNSALQAAACRKLDGKEVKAGDLVFFATGKDPQKISHVGIMVGDKEFIHASTRKGVIISDITTPYYERTFIMFGRPE